MTLQAQPGAGRLTLVTKYNFTECDLNWMQINKDSTDEIAAFIDQISVKEGTMV